MVRGLAVVQAEEVPGRGQGAQSAGHVGKLRHVRKTLQVRFHLFLDGVDLLQLFIILLEN